MVEIIKNCLKISFQGDMQLIYFDASSSYEQIMRQASEKFNVPANQRSALVLTNGRGYVFEQQLFEYFLMLFPSPQLVFHMRFDWNRLRRALTSTAAAEPNTTAKRRREEHETQQPLECYAAVPVHRQNCFIGTLPRVLEERQMDRSNLEQQQQQQQNNEEPRFKRLRLTLQRQPRGMGSSMAMVTATPNYTRSLRI